MFVCRWRIQSPLRYINPGKVNEIPGVCSRVLLDIRGAEKRLGVGVQVGTQSPTAPLYWVIGFLKLVAKFYISTREPDTLLNTQIYRIT